MQQLPHRVPPSALGLEEQVRPEKWRKEDHLIQGVALLCLLRWRVLQKHRLSVKLCFTKKKKNQIQISVFREIERQIKIQT